MEFRPEAEGLEIRRRSGVNVRKKTPACRLRMLKGALERRRIFCWVPPDGFRPGIPTGRRNNHCQVTEPSAPRVCPFLSRTGVQGVGRFPEWPRTRKKTTHRNRSRWDLERSNLLNGSRFSWVESEPDRCSSRGVALTLP
jgi:hypothetical protein